MSTVYILSVTLHVLAALLWLGGMFFLAAVGAPVLRTLEPPSLRADLFRRIGERARLWGWGSIAVLVVTGLVNLHYRGLLSVALWTDPAFWSSPVGRALGWKLATVAIVVGTSAVHDFRLGPRAGRTDLPPDVRAGLRRRAALLGRITALVGILLVYWAVRLARGG